MNGPTDSTTDDILESDGSCCILVPSKQETPKSPLLICFHGSGTGALGSWTGLLDGLTENHPVVFLDRGSRNPKPEEHIRVLWNFLQRHRLIGPYIVIAHSYGGAFAKCFLQAHHGSVAGMVLVETGKGGSSNRIKAVLDKTRLGSKPLSVIRGNSFLRQWRALKAAVNDKAMGIESQAHIDREEWLKNCQAEDEKLEKDQLRLSHNSRFVQLLDCGHNVVLERPDAVLQEVEWIVAQYWAQTSNVSWLERAKEWFSASIRRS